MSQSHDEADRELPPGIPRWLKVSVIVVIVLILLFGILHLSTGNGMGPGMHMPSMEQGTQQP